MYAGMQQSAKQTSTSSKVSKGALLSLLGLAAAESALAIYQWAELWTVQAGAKPLCAMSETVDCTKVWASTFAGRVHGLTQLPVAGMGLLWGLVALGLALRAFLAVRKTGDARSSLLSALRLWGIAGALSCVTLGAASLQAGAVCPLCVTTYVLVAAFAVLTFRLPGAFPPAGDELKSALRSTVALLVPLYLALLVPGMKTPKLSASSLEATQSASNVAAGGDYAAVVEGFLRSLPWAQQQVVSESLDIYRQSTAQDVSQFQVRQRLGSPDAPTQIVDFTDIACGHCRALVETLEQVEKAVPATKWSVQPRHFPLDSECNKEMKGSDGKGIRCLGAKAQICLEGAPDYWDLRRKLFEAQQQLTKDKILEIASSGSMGRDALTACIASPATQAKLDDDIRFAMLYKPKGTPIVVVNGREGTPNAAWLYSMAMLDSNVDARPFKALPGQSQTPTSGARP